MHTQQYHRSDLALPFWAHISEWAETPFTLANSWHCAPGFMGINTPSRKHTGHLQALWNVVLRCSKCTHYRKQEDIHVASDFFLIWEVARDFVCCSLYRFNHIAALLSMTQRVDHIPNLLVITFILLSHCCWLNGRNVLLIWPTATFWSALGDKV